MVNEGRYIEDRLESYVETMYGASEILLDRSPDFILAPMNGSVPFIDAMTIVNPNFDPSKVVYMPASSKIENIGDVITDWYLNFLNHTVRFPYEFPKVIGIDEVVSGNSVVRCLKNIDRAISRKRKREVQTLAEMLTSPEEGIFMQVIDEIRNISEDVDSIKLAQIRRNFQDGTYSRDHVRAKEDLNFCLSLARKAFTQGINYTTIGIEDSKREVRTKEYEEMKSRGRIIPLGVKSIISMDVPDFYPPRFYETRSGNSNVKFSPVVKDFYITPRYLEFLQSLARAVGKDARFVNPVNMIPILDSNKYLNPRYKTEINEDSQKESPKQWLC